MNEIKELKAARKKIKKPKSALADAHMDWRLESASLEITCEHMGATAEAVKNTTLMLADVRKKRGLR